MYYEEMVINGVLHWRGTPNGLFQPRTAEYLTKELLEIRAQYAEVGDRISEIKSRLERITGRDV